MPMRPYEPERDFDAWFRLHLEAGWCKDGERAREAHRIYASCGRVLVGEVGGQAEAYASTHEGTIRHLEHDLPASVVSGVITGRLARRQGFGLRLTAEAIAADALERDAAVALLGIFDQGYYDRLGFASGPYEIVAAIDPADLRFPAPASNPVRLDAHDWERVHASRAARRLRHGALVMSDPRFTRYELLHRESSIGLGFTEEAGDALTHHLYAMPSESDAWRIHWLAFGTADEFRDLMGLVASLSDQVVLVRLFEPPGIQLQRLVARPFRRSTIARNGELAATNRALAWWQARILDLPACLAATRLPASGSVTFRLELTDPIADFLSDETRARWHGAGGTWTVTLGSESSAEPVTKAEGSTSLPAMRTSVNTFTRLWLGVTHPADLAFTAPDLQADPGLLERLDRVVRLPRPSLDWDV